MAPRLELDVSYAARRPWVPDSRQLAGWAAAALAPARRAPAGAASRRRCIVLSVRVVGQARSRSLNAHYRRKDKPTNVLSFRGAGDAPDGRHHLGELVICAPVVAREAQASGRPLQAHWAHMTVHGVLHLLGFDHEAAPEAVKMAAMEIQILDRLGFSDPYC
ncbi:MAG: rRNA maturation RNase YbeY [Steroidobacteraceae bacterium]